MEKFEIKDEWHYFWFAMKNKIQFVNLEQEVCFFFSPIVRFILAGCSVFLTSICSHLLWLPCILHTICLHIKYLLQSNADPFIKDSFVAARHFWEKSGKNLRKINYIALSSLPCNVNMLWTFSLVLAIFFSAKYKTMRLSRFVFARCSPVCGWCKVIRPI